MVRGRADAVVDAAGPGLFQVEAMVLRRNAKNIATTFAPTHDIERSEGNYREK
jgi:hypothetical protein